MESEAPQGCMEQQWKNFWSITKNSCVHTTNGWIHVHAYRFGAFYCHQLCDCGKVWQKRKTFLKFGAPCGFSGRFEDGSFSMKTKMICSNLHWRMKMWRTQISGLLNNEDYQLPHLLKMKIAFLKLLKTEDLNTPLKNVKKNEDHFVCREPQISPQKAPTATAC